MIFSTEYVCNYGNELGNQKTVAMGFMVDNHASPSGYSLDLGNSLAALR